MIRKNSNEMTLPEKEDFHNHLNMEDITDADQTHQKCSDFQIKHLEEYFDSYVQSYKFFLADVFENF